MLKLDLNRLPTTDIKAANVLLKHPLAARMTVCTVPLVKDSAALMRHASPVCRQDPVILGGLKLACMENKFSLSEAMLWSLPLGRRGAH